jgi:carbon monoxide dehydrogenase subunit G
VRIELAAVVAASPERIWEVLADWERQASWMPDVAWIRIAGPEREDGARLRVRTKVFGIPAVIDDVVVTGWVPPRRLAVEHRGLVKGRGEWRLEPFGSGTRFIWIEELSLPVPVIGEAALLAYRPVQAALLRRSMSNLRMIMEQPRTV